VTLEPFRVRHNGADLAGVRFGQGRPLLLVHPIVFSKAFYVAAADVFGARFSCAAFDQRGHGESQGTVELEGMTEDIGAVLDHLGWEAAILGGTSLGAATTLRYALRHPGRVTLLLQDLPGFGPGTVRTSDRTERMAEAFEKGDLDEAARRTVEGLSPHRAKAWRDALEADWRHYDPAVIGPKMAEALRGTRSWKIVDRWPEDLARLAVPTSILALQGDPSHPYEVAQAMARTIPQATLVPRIPSLSPATIARQWVEVIGGAGRGR
jgi:pimeloyl-ACP methyl ester carboxylesterase